MHNLRWVRLSLLCFALGLFLNSSSGAASRYDRLDRELSALQDRVYNLEKENQELKGRIADLENELKNLIRSVESDQMDGRGMLEELEALKKQMLEKQSEAGRIDEIPDPLEPVTGADPIRILYNHAYELYNLRDYKGSIQQFSLFLAKYRTSYLADNAKYWIGECHYALGDYARALDTFSGVLEDYSGGNKVPDAYLRTGYCLEILGKNSRALEIFEEVAKKFPGTAVADKAEDKISLLSIR